MHALVAGRVVTARGGRVVVLRAQRSCHFDLRAQAIAIRFHAHQFQNDPMVLVAGAIVGAVHPYFWRAVEHADDGVDLPSIIHADDGVDLPSIIKVAKGCNAVGCRDLKRRSRLSTHILKLEISEISEYAIRQWIRAVRQLHGIVEYVGVGAAFSLLLTLRGVPQIYSGDEIALPGRADPDNRRDFPEVFQATRAMPLHQHDMPCRSGI
jgi:hypothetical protein